MADAQPDWKDKLARFVSPHPDTRRIAKIDWLIQLDHSLQLRGSGGVTAFLPLRRLRALTKSEHRCWTAASEVTKDVTTNVRFYESPSGVRADGDRVLQKRLYVHSSVTSVGQIGLKRSWPKAVTKTSWPEAVLAQSGRGRHEHVPRRWTFQ